MPAAIPASTSSPRMAPAASRPPPQRRTRQSEEERAARWNLLAMGFQSFVGRVLFASTFFLSAYQEYEGSEFGLDGGLVTNSLEPKFNLFVRRVSIYTGMSMPHMEMKTVIFATLYVRAIGGGTFILYSNFGALLLLVYLSFITPVVYDFYNYEMWSPQFVQLLTQFSQNLAYFGALLFFLGMKTSIPTWASKRKMAKTKATGATRYPKRTMAKTKAT